MIISRSTVRGRYDSPRGGHLRHRRIFGSELRQDPRTELMDLLAERASGSGQQIFLLGRQDRPIGNRDTVEDLCNERRSSRRILTARLIRRNCFNLWSQLAISQLQWTHRAAMEPSHSLRNGASLPIVSIGRNSPGSCDVDNRAFAVKAANAFPR